EAVATFVLVFAIKGMGQVLTGDGSDASIGKFIVFVIIMSCGMSFGGTTGYAMNPARDLGPRLAHAILPIKNKGTSNFAYGLIVPIFGPIIGALLAVGLYAVIPW
ncbi:MAG: aquaporin, partial [Lachnospiraceae bacterium]|nr:aquaporin [Lachnospiraceae bacterium]